MSEKRVIVGNTVGPPLPKSDLRETDPKKGSYVLGRELLLRNVKTVNGKAPDENGNVEVKTPEGSGGTGLTNAEKTLILSLFRNAAYTSADMGSVLAQLEALWSGGGSGGGEVEPDNPVEPDEPDEPGGDSNIINPVTAYNWDSGYRLYGNADVQEGENFFTSEYISTENIEKIVATALTKITSYAVFFFDESKKYMSKESNYIHPSHTTYPPVAEITIPAGAAYLRFSTSQSSSLSGSSPAMKYEIYMM